MHATRFAWSVLPLLALMLLLAGCATPPTTTAPSAPPAGAPPAAAPEAAPPPAGPPSVSSDQDFLNQALGMGAAQIGMGRLAESKAAARPVKLLATRMVVDHTHANRRLEALARSLGLNVTPIPDQPPPDLLAASGPDFDKLYVDMTTKGHQNLIALFESEENGGQNPRIEHLAHTMLIELRRLLHEAEALGNRSGG